MGNLFVNLNIKAFIKWFKNETLISLFHWKSLIKYWRSWEESHESSGSIYFEAYAYWFIDFLMNLCFQLFHHFYQNIFVIIQIINAINSYSLFFIKSFFIHHTLTFIPY